jgi:hypothetical protein
MSLPEILEEFGKIFIAVGFLLSSLLGSSCGLEQYQSDLLLRDFVRSLFCHELSSMNDRPSENGCERDFYVIGPYNFLKDFILLRIINSV